ncbi:MAG: hypothetical protein ACLTW9_24075 [Enterocloster sp.]
MTTAFFWSEHDIHAESVKSISPGDQEQSAVMRYMNLQMRRCRRFDSRTSGAPSYIHAAVPERLNLRNFHKFQNPILNRNYQNIVFTFFARRTATDVPNTRKLTQMFMDIITVTKTLGVKRRCCYWKSQVKLQSAICALVTPLSMKN